MPAPCHTLTCTFPLAAAGGRATRLLRTRAPRLLAGAALGAVLLTSLPARADLVFLGGGDDTQSTYFVSQVYSGFHDVGGGPTSYAIDEGTIYSSNVAPGGLVQDRSVASNMGATRYANSYSVESGFFASRNYAHLTVTNANAADGYYAVAGSGSRSSVRFFGAPDAVSATYRWHVSGSSNLGLGEGTSRLDFRARQQGVGGSWFDIFNPNEPHYTPGDYSFTLSGDFNLPFDLLYWSSAYVQVPLGGAPTGSNFSSTADFSNTYVLEGIELYDAQDVLLDGWTMVDESSGLAVFDAAGRIDALAPPPVVPPNEPDTQVPEPGTLFSASLALMLMGWMRRRPR